jgi:hypothetical protein
VFSCAVTSPPLPATSGPIDVFLPLPGGDDRQDVLATPVLGELPSRVRAEPDHGIGEPLTITLTGGHSAATGADYTAE